MICACVDISSLLRVLTSLIMLVGIILLYLMLGGLRSYILVPDILKILLLCHTRPPQFTVINQNVIMPRPLVCDWTMRHLDIPPVPVQVLQIFSVYYIKSMSLSSISI